MISASSSGSFQKTQTRLRRMRQISILDILNANGQAGVDALARATPTDTGLTAISWGFEVRVKNGVYRIVWTNSDVENGFPVAIMLQYGYGTGTGGYVQGQDYINPAIKPIFDRIASQVRKAVTSA